MFYLGSISGILPYILAFSLTIVLGSHAHFPFLKGGAIEESSNKISNEKSITVGHSSSFTYKKQIVTEDIRKFAFTYFKEVKVIVFYPFRLTDYSGIGISLLRAPPVSPF
jgi:hypothetical protein